MNDVLFDYLHQFCQIYLDDIIIYSKTLKKHKRHIRLVLHRLQETDFQMNINKCKFHVQKIFFLRLLLFIEELKMNLRKVQAVVEWSTSTNLTQMQFFVNFCNFYWRFIKSFSKIVHSLIQLTQKEMIFEWNQACQMIFDHMKKWMTEVSILRHFNQNKKTILETNSFNYVNNDILSQYDDEETLHSMIYYSKNLSLAECNYKIYDKKLLAIIHVFKHWWSELKLTELLIKMFTDNLLQAYQDWIKLVSVFSSDLTQSLFSFINISLFNIIFLSTSHSTCVTNTFSSSLAQSLNIT